LENQLYEDCVSRSYYAVLHAAKAALIKIGVEAESHRAVRRMFGLHLVKTEQIEKHFSQILTAQQERAAKRVHDAERFVRRIEKYLGVPPSKKDLNFVFAKNTSEVPKTVVNTNLDRKK
jgi:hypothetical protein